MFQDIRYGLRILAKKPGFTLIAVLSLALGIGANTAIFSLVDAVMIKSLPVQQPEQFVLFGKGEDMGMTNGFPDREFRSVLLSFLSPRTTTHRRLLRSRKSAEHPLDHARVR